jgi:hypothetical protein
MKMKMKIVEHMVVLRQSITRKLSCRGALSYRNRRMKHDQKLWSARRFTRLLRETRSAEPVPSAGVLNSPLARSGFRFKHKKDKYRH